MDQKHVSRLPVQRREFLDVATTTVIGQAEPDLRLLLHPWAVARGLLSLRDAGWRATDATPRSQVFKW
jgi:hypothetical protein